MSLSSLGKPTPFNCVLHTSILPTNLSPFFLRLMPVAQQVTDTMCSDHLQHEQKSATMNQYQLMPLP